MLNISCFITACTVFDSIIDLAFLQLTILYMVKFILKFFVIIAFFPYGSLLSNVFLFFVMFVELVMIILQEDVDKIDELLNNTTNIQISTRIKNCIETYIKMKW